MKFLITIFASLTVVLSTYGQQHLHVINNTGGEIAKLESKMGFPKLVLAHNNSNIAEIGITQTTNGMTDHDLTFKTLKDFGKIMFRVGGNTAEDGLMTINPNSSTGAYVGINVSSPSAPLTVASVKGGGVTAEFRAGPNADNTWLKFTGQSGADDKGFMGFPDNENIKDFYIGTRANNAKEGKLRFQTLDEDRMWIAPEGQVFIGDISLFPDVLLSSPQSLNICGNVQASGSFTSNAFACNSDSRYKTNIKSLNQSLDKVLALEGVNYTWNQEKFPHMGFSSDKQIGLIAQDVEKVFPELVETDEQGYKSVDYVSLTAVLIEAIKEQQETINTLAEKVNRITELENKIASIAALK